MGPSQGTCLLGAAGLPAGISPLNFNSAWIAENPMAPIGLIDPDANEASEVSFSTAALWEWLLLKMDL